MTANHQPVPDLSALAFRGKDAAAFLQGQLTINTAALAAGRWQRAAYCSRQGRVLANGLLARLGEEELLFVMCADLAGSVAAMLRKFVLRAKVEIIPLAAPVFAAAGDGEQAAVAMPSGSVAVSGDIVEIDEGGGRRLLVGTGETPGAEAAAGSSGGSAWWRSEIQRGVGWVGAATQDMFIPQFINLELLGAVDFQKGCFVGQEVIARLHHLGKVKQRGMVIRGAGEAAAAMPVKTADGKPAGAVVNAAAAPEGGGFTAFAALAREAGGGLEVNGSPVSAQPPPYEIVEQEKFRRSR